MSYTLISARYGTIVEFEFESFAAAMISATSEDRHGEAVPLRLICPDRVIVRDEHPYPHKKGSLQDMMEIWERVIWGEAC